MPVHEGGATTSTRCYGAVGWRVWAGEAGRAGGGRSRVWARPAGRWGGGVMGVGFARQRVLTGVRHASLRRHVRAGGAEDPPWRGPRAPAGVRRAQGAPTGDGEEETWGGRPPPFLLLPTFTGRPVHIRWPGGGHRLWPLGRRRRGRCGRRGRGSSARLRAPALTGRGRRRRRRRRRARRVQRALHVLAAERGPEAVPRLLCRGQGPHADASAGPVLGGALLARGHGRKPLARLNAAGTPKVGAGAPAAHGASGCGCPGTGWGGGAWDRHAQSFASPTQICLFGGSPHFLHFCNFAH
jgi:hypothetical protein